MSIDTSTFAIVGATGAVGRETISILYERGVPANQILALASARSTGARLAYGEREIPVYQLREAAAEDAFGRADVMIFAADAETSRAYTPLALQRGAIVVDNSSAFRLDDDVPLVVPEVNGALLEGRQVPRIVANPNCSTILLLVALEPLRASFGVRSVVVSTYQAVSGAGIAAIDELRSQSRAVLEGSERVRRVFAEPCAFNVFSHDSAIDPATGLNGEERKLIDETRKIWDDPRLSITPTCVRVPVERAHSESVVVELRQPAHEDEVRRVLERAPGVRVIDDRVGNAFPTPLKASGIDDVLVGRIRPDPGAGFDGRGRCTRWCLWLSGDQIRKGAALNAVQIAERLLALHPRHAVSQRSDLARATDAEGPESAGSLLVRATL